ncbi:MAG: hypothetical protein JWR84_1968 [Caulobacter sp.]|nr:hypothetical protein [Caulobacter sp.]
MTDLAAVIPYTTVTADMGVAFFGGPDQSLGQSARIIGDVNGDGLADILIGGSSTADASGEAYVVFGKQGGFNTADFDLASLDGTNGFKITGRAGDRIGAVVAGGDLNGDGYADILVNAPTNSFFVSNAGGTYIIFGGQAFAPTLSMNDINGSNAVLVRGFVSNQQLGTSMASAGDLNNDGYDDLIMGAETAALGAGQAYILWGSATLQGGLASFSAQNDAKGFYLTSEGPNFQTGASVSAAGDVNGDGFDDLIVGAPGANASQGAAYIVFGRDGASDPFAPFNLANLSATGQGVRITGAGFSFGQTVSAAGDVNGDGRDDIIVGGSNHAWVIFGGVQLTADFSLAGMKTDQGFAITGTGSLSYRAAAPVGDLNGDGYDEIILGAYQRSSSAGTQAGAAYVIYGRADFGAGFSNIQNGGTGVVSIEGVTAFDKFGRGVGGGGDVNGDGRPDLVVSGIFLDHDGNGTAGGAVVIYAPDPDGPVSYIGSGANDSRSGGVGADSLSGLGGNDMLYGLDGDDVLDGGDLSDQLFGGVGADDLVGGGGGDILYGEDGDDDLSGDDGADKLFGGDGTDQLNGGLGNDRMDGGSGIDTLDGGSGNDVLDGGPGADVLRGGADNDVYIVDDLSDQTIELAGEGYDIVRTAVSGWRLADNVEALELQGNAFMTGLGNNLANNLQGNAGMNILFGYGGVDTINGNDGDDTVVGGAGNDLLRGGLGADSFVVADESFGSGVLETDQVYDFSAAEGDYLDLSLIDANSRVAGLQAFRLVDAFSKFDAAHPENTGQMTLIFAGGITTVRLEVNGDAKVDYQMKINGDVTGESGNWFL